MAFSRCWPLPLERLQLQGRAITGNYLGAAGKSAVDSSARLSAHDAGIRLVYGWRVRELVQVRPSALSRFVGASLLFIW